MEESVFSKFSVSGLLLFIYLLQDRGITEWSCRMFVVNIPNEIQFNSTHIVYLFIFFKTRNSFKKNLKEVGISAGDQLTTCKLMDR